MKKFIINHLPNPEQAGIYAAGSIVGGGIGFTTGLASGFLSNHFGAGGIYVPFIVAGVITKLALDATPQKESVQLSKNFKTAGYGVFTASFIIASMLLSEKGFFHHMKDIRNQAYLNTTQITEPSFLKN